MKKLQMKKLAASTIVAAAMFSTAMPAAQAASTGATPFNVLVSFTSLCTVASIPNLNFGTYTAFGSASVATPATSVTVTCTRGLPATPTLAFDAAGGTVAGLSYSVSVGLTTPAFGNPATIASIGTADTYTIGINGSMAGGQAGDSSALQTDTRTVVITY